MLDRKKIKKRFIIERTYKFLQIKITLIVCVIFTKKIIDYLFGTISANIISLIKRIINLFFYKYFWK